MQYLNWNKMKSIYSHTTCGGNRSQGGIQSSIAMSIDLSFMTEWRKQSAIHSTCSGRVVAKMCRYFVMLVHSHRKKRPQQLTRTCVIGTAHVWIESYKTMTPDHAIHNGWAFSQIIDINDCIKVIEYTSFQPHAELIHWRRSSRKLVAHQKAKAKKQQIDLII